MDRPKGRRQTKRDTKTDAGNSIISSDLKHRANDARDGLSSYSNRRVLVGKPEGKRPLGRPRRRWVDNIRVDLQKVGCGYMDWIGLAQDGDRWRTLVSAVMNLRVP